jgi:antitoxin (DNA-binding transcriptional repressor) of toxin-antitoxin stability system
VVLLDISQAGELSEVLAQLGSGDEVILSKAGKPVAKVIPWSAQPRKPGSMAGEIRIASDFDELPDDMAAALGMSSERD